MKNLRIGRWVFIMASFFSPVHLMAQRVKAKAQDKPNILIILADDLGWADLSCYGSSFYETPNLDRLARKGVRFEQAYASSPVCSPTRASLLTGKNPVSTGVTDWIRGRQENGKAMPYEKFIMPPPAYQLALEETTIAELALSNGYSTFFAGKWHLGEEDRFWPEHQGFQTNLGGWSKGSPSAKIDDSTGGYFTPYKNPRLNDGPKGEYITDRLTDECIHFIDSIGKHPFLMMYSLYAVHNPMQAPAALIRKYKEKQRQLGYTPKQRFAKDEPWMKNEAGWKRRLVQDDPVYAAMIENMDSNIGRLLKGLEDKGMLENTVVIFTSDNGGLSTAEGSPTVNTPYRSGKGWLYEGGIRVPLLLYWKGRTKEGTISDVPVISTDIFPTLAKAMVPAYKKTKDQEGVSLMNLLQHSYGSKERTLYWHYPHYSNQGGKPTSAMRTGDLKLIYDHETGTIELYDLRQDPSETKDISKSAVAKAALMKKSLLSWIRKNTVMVPKLNPDHVPAKVDSADKSSNIN